MNIQDKIEAIRKACESGNVARRDIDTTDCRATGKILKGESVKDQVVERIYQRLVAIQGRTRQVENKAPDEKPKRGQEQRVKGVVIKSETSKGPLPQAQVKQDRLQGELHQLRDKVNELEGRIKHLEKENQELEEENKVLRERLHEIFNPPKNRDDLYGFSLTRREAGNGQNEYYYAGKLIAGKRVWIYVGKTPIKAREKVRDWLTKNQPALLDTE